MGNITLKSIDLPEFGLPEEMPPLPAAEYEKRIENTIASINKKGIDILLIFADREHFANFRYLTGLDPRFEEAILLLDRNGKRKIIFGNETLGAGGKSPVHFEYELFQEFSLLGQDRSRCRTLEEILKEFGVGRNKKIGTAYYKYFTDSNRNIYNQNLDIPAYLADILRDLTGSSGAVSNANDIFMNPFTGLRSQTCLEELVQFEWASTRTSESIKQLVKHIQPGVREYELGRYYISDGLPYSCHPMVSTGEKAKYGLLSPSSDKITLGDPFTSAFGIWGALTCRAGMVADGPAQLDKKVAEFYEKLWKNYFQSVVAWYESLRVGVTAGEVFKKADEARDNTIFDFALNTGHTIHLDEWVNSPFYSGSEVKLLSGTALQADIIPVPKGGVFVAANFEDGVVLADETLRSNWAKQYPESWRRIHLRREFMIERLGINISRDVLPLGNMPAYYSPYLLAGNMVAVNF